MTKWPIALALLVSATGLHAFGLLRQIRHYRDVFGELSDRWRGARIGTGSSGGIAPSAMAILVADDHGIVQAARLRIGAGSFAKFWPREDFVGLSLADLRAKASTRGVGADVAEAISQAIGSLEGPTRPAGQPDLS